MRNLRNREVNKLIKINRWMENLNKMKNIVIVVEGKTDKVALEKIGVKHDILIFYREDFWRKIELLSYSSKRIIILTDFDKEGDNLNKRIFRYAISNNIEILENERNNFRIVTKGLGNQIYEIVRGITRLIDKYS